MSEVKNATIKTEQGNLISEKDLKFKQYLREYNFESTSYYNISKIDNSGWFPKETYICQIKWDPKTETATLDCYEISLDTTRVAAIIEAVYGWQVIYNIEQRREFYG
jgi:hypothetical protein